MRSFSPLLATVVATLSLAACGTPMSGQTTGGMGNGGMAGMHGGHDDGEAPETVDGADEISVTATDLAFDRESLELVAGEPVNITLTNRGDVFHDLHVEGTDFMLDADPGTTLGGALTIEEPGSYEFRCTVPGHASAGMLGTITVSG